MIIDGHVHIGGPSERRAEPEQVLEVMDQLGIAAAVVFPVRGLAPDNKGLARKIDKYRHRYIGFGWINPWWGLKALEEIEMLIEQEGFKGIKLHPIAHGFSPMMEMLRPVMDKAAELGIVVLIHSGQPPFSLPWEIGELAELYPQVPIIMAHMGMNPETMVAAAIRVAAKIPNIILDTSAMPFHAKIKAAVQTIGANRVVFGTDAPLLYQNAELEKIRWAGLTPGEEAKILGENLASLLDFEVTKP